MISNFAIIFLSIFIEATPFILLGVLLSSLIQVFVSEEAMRRLIPRSAPLALLVAGLGGLVFPVCECGIIPITRRLIKKGVPPYVAVTFMLAVPIINPVVIASTYYAFSGDLGYVLFRVLLGFFVSVGIGYVISRVYRNNPVLRDDAGDDDSTLAVNRISCCEKETAACDCSAGAIPLPHKPGVSRVISTAACGCGDASLTVHGTSLGFGIRVRELFQHAAGEFFFVGKFLIVGALLASVTHVYLPRSVILNIGEGPVSSVLTMMGFAFLISLCSEADAFIAATFINSFTAPSIIAFMVFGPMLDIKNLIMMGAVFNRKFLLLLVGLIILLVFAGAMYLQWLII